MEYSVVFSSVDGEVYLLTLRDNRVVLRELHDTGNNLEKLSQKYQHDYLWMI